MAGVDSCNKMRPVQALRSGLPLCIDGLTEEVDWGRFLTSHFCLSGKACGDLYRALLMSEREMRQQGPSHSWIARAS